VSHYLDREEFFDGNVVVFRRGDAWSQGDKRFWNTRLKIAGRVGFKTISLKTRNRDEAVALAKAKFLELSQLVKDGGSLESRTFERAWREWYASMVAAGAWKPDRQKWHLNYFNRYFRAYFGDKKLVDITPDFASGYWDWRRRYWVDGEGVNQISYNRRRKGMKTPSTHNAKKEVSIKTLQMEQSALNQFLHWCCSNKRYMRYPIRLKAQGGEGGGRRPTFDNSEWLFLTRNLRSWVDLKGKYASDRLNAFHLHHRQQLRFYVLFLASTGIRSGTETRFMKWEDIQFRENDVRVRVRRATKMGKARVVISQPNVVGWLKEWKSVSHYPDDQDYVWYGMSKKGEPQQVATDLNKTFQSFLRSVDYHGRKDGLLFDGEGDKRTLYSLRHFYATQRLLQGVSYEDLCRNMGTGIQQLVKHYDWATTEQRAAEITKMSFPRRKEVPDTDTFLASLSAEQKDELIKKLSGKV
jgi:integrase